MERVVYDLELDGFKPFIKHVPVPERPSLIKDLRAYGQHYIQTDYSAFEASFAPEFMNVCECELYRRLLANHPVLAEMICQTLIGLNRCSTRQGVRFQCCGKRMSGDMCTSLGNGFTNLMLWSFICERHGYKWKGYVEGDDGIFAVSHTPKVSEFAEFGFELKLQEYPDPSLASFCGIVLVDDDIIRDPYKFLANFGWTDRFHYAKSKVQAELLRAKALSTCYETPQCPIVGVLARRALEDTRSVRPRYVDDGYHTAPPDEFKIPSFKPSDSVRAVFGQLYGISPQLQLEIESLVESKKFDQVVALMPAPEQYVRYASAYVT